jgi:hypothetical protein
MPTGTEWRASPFQAMRQVVNVFRLTEAHNSDIAHQKRMAELDDVVKRKQYRKAHGLEGESKVGRWLGASYDKESGVVSAPGVASVDMNKVVASREERAQEKAQERKKFLGIF